MKKMTKFIIFLAALVCIISSIVLGAQTPTLQTTKKSICIAETYTLKINNLPKGAKVTYSSNKASIAIVNRKGIVTGVTDGKCKVNAKIQNGSKTYNLTLNITVKKPNFTTRSTALIVGDKAVLKISNQPKKGATYTWNSSNSKVVSVKNGTIKGLKTGNATVTVNIKTSKKTYRLKNVITVSKKTKTEADYLSHLTNIDKKHTGTDGSFDSQGAYEDVIKTAKEYVMDILLIMKRMIMA